MSNQNRDLGSRVGVAVLLVPLVVGCLLVPSLWTILLFTGWLVVAVELFGAMRGVSPDASRACWMQLVIVTLGLFAAFLLRQSSWGIALVLLPMASVIATDTSAYFGGRRFGIPGTFFPRLSPNKSLAGAIFGIGGGILAGGLAICVIVRLESNFPVVPGLVAASLIPMFAVMGDLLESRVKRLCGIKDFTVLGKPLLRAHGGVNDRVDALVTGWICTYLVILISGSL